MSRWPATIVTNDMMASEDDSLRREAKDWLIHLTTGKITQDDLRALERWRAQSPEHAQAYDQACDLWQAIGAPLQVAAGMKATRPARYPTARRDLGRRAFLGRAFLGGALAASAAGIMVVRPPFDLWPSLTELAVDYRTAAGEQRQIPLADNGSIRMNTRTSLNLDRAGGAVDKIELVAGEAAIAAGTKPLSVLAAAGFTSAQNAQFIVRCDDAVVKVTCLAGVIDIAYGGRNVTVQPRQQVIYAKQRLSPAMQIDPEVVAGWRDGLLIFDNASLSHVIDEVNRYRRERIILANTELGERRITVRFKIDRLDAVLTQFQAVFGAKVTSLPGGFVLLS